MADIREALAALIEDHILDEGANECSCEGWEHWEDPYPERIAEHKGHVADAILAAFDVTPRGVHNHDIDPACPETRLPDGSLRGECVTSATERGEGGQPGCTGAGDCPATAHTHGCYADTKGHCEHPEEHGWTPPTVKPSVEDVARALAELNEDTDWEGGVESYLPDARAALALLPGRTEAEVYREGYDQGLRDAASVSRSEAEVKIEALRWAASVAVADDEGIPWDDDHDRAAVSTWLLGLAARIEKGEGRG